MLDSHSSRVDQASGLRNIHRSAGGRARNELRVLPIVTGMRGVGHTVTTINLAAALGNAAQRVVVLDAGRALIAAALKLKARYELLHLLTGEKSIGETMLHADLFDVLPAIKGVDEFLSSGMAAEDLFSGFTALANPYNVAILAVSGNAAAALTPADTEITFVTNDSADSMKSTYAELKRLATDFGRHRFRIIFNDIIDERAAQDSYARLADTAQRFFHAELALGGVVPRDVSVRRATASCAHVFAAEPSPARHTYTRIAAEINDWQLAGFPPVTMQ
jgi:flagellar biosynthesis protein FlhG